jgi:aspartyl-tRNA(Asn)/glutamyl-tRNA(Gln) amidotransferase subunit A
MTLGELVDAPSLRRAVSAVEAAQLFLERIDDEQPQLYAFITPTPELALDDARRVDHARTTGSRLPLDGMPIAVKDNVDVAGIRTTVGSRLFEGRVAERDAEVVRRLRAAGGVIVGKSNLHELAFGATSRNETFGYVVNPIAPDRIPGGSSGGSAAAVAADLCVVGIGTDTGGSVRLPASMCGVTGVRPTFRAVSCRGVQPVSRSLDTVGPLARSARDLAAVLAVVAGPDGLDDLDAGVAGLRVGLLEELVDRSDAAVGAAVREVGAVLGDLGARLERLELSGVSAAAEACGQLIKAEAFAVYRDVLATTPYLLEEGTRRRLALGDLPPAALGLARRELQIWMRRLRETFQFVDLVLLPTMPIDTPAADGADTVETTAAVVPYTHAVSLARCPSISLPCASTPSGAPVGAQLAAAWGADGLVLRVAAAVQAATDWHRRRPAERPHVAGSTRTTS